jgi:hypothetical protein
MPRTKGKRNKDGHSAGGDRRSAEFHQRQADKQAQKREVEARRQSNLAKRRERDREAAAQREEERNEKRKKRIEQTRMTLNDISEDDLEHLFHRHSIQDAGSSDEEDDDDDYGSDEEEDYETEDEGEGEVKQRRLRQRAAYKPGEGTAIGNALKQFKQTIHGDKSKGQMTIMNDVRNQIMRGKQWFA